MLDQTAINAALDRQSQLTKPPGSLGRLETLAIWLAGCQDRPFQRLIMFSVFCSPLIMALHNVGCLPFRRK